MPWTFEKDANSDVAAEPAKELAPEPVQIPREELKSFDPIQGEIQNL